jgi:hypothetical protein
VIFAFVLVSTICVPAFGAQPSQISAQLPAPVAIYSQSTSTGNSAAAEPVSEAQALREVDELQRLKKAGMRFDYDLIGIAAFAPNGAFRTLRASAWPGGPDAWISKCRAAGVRPGLRFGGNMIAVMQASPAWSNSLAQDGHSLSLFEGGYLPDLVAAMQTWYDRGVRLFAFDGFNLSAATPASVNLTRDQIAARNANALRDAFASFRAKNRDAILMISVDTGSHADLSQLAASGAFTFVSTGAPRPSAIPEASLWRSLDIESDDAVRRFEQAGIPLAQIDSPGFVTSGNAGSDARPWKGTFLLSMARGGWLNTVQGDLSSLQDADARWSARAQKLFLKLQQTGTMHSFGGSPGGSQPYGFAGVNEHGSVYVVVNPGQSVATLTLPKVNDHKSKDGRVQFRDAGFEPRLSGNAVTLGPGQMAVVGYGSYASSAFNFGVQQDVVIPQSIEPVDADFKSTDSGTLEASLDPPVEGVVRVIVRPRDAGSQPATSQKNAQAFTLEAMQYGRPIPVRLDSSSGSQWVVGEIDVNDLTPGIPLKVTLEANDNAQASLEASAYAVEY